VHRSVVMKTQQMKVCLTNHLDDNKRETDVLIMDVCIIAIIQTSMVLM